MQRWLRRLIGSCVRLYDCTKGLGNEISKKGTNEGTALLVAHHPKGINEQGRLQAGKPDGSASRILLRRETGEPITHAPCFSLRAELAWEADGRILG